MTELEFYNMCDSIEMIDTEKVNKQEVIPTLDELKEAVKIVKNKEYILPVMIYLAGNPLKERNPRRAGTPEYKEAVAFAKDYLESIPLQ